MQKPETSCYFHPEALATGDFSFTDTNTFFSVDVCDKCSFELTPETFLDAYLKTESERIEAAIAHQIAAE